MKPTEEPCDEKKLLYGKCARNICLHLYITIYIHYTLLHGFT